MLRRLSGAYHTGRVTVINHGGLVHADHRCGDLAPTTSGEPFRITALTRLGCLGEINVIRSEMATPWGISVSKIEIDQFDLDGLNEAQAILSVIRIASGARA